MIAAAPRPWTARAAISASEVVLSAEAMEARVKTVEPGDHHPAAAEPVAERGGGQHERGEGQRVGVHEPRQLADRRAEVGLDHRQRAGHHEVVEGGHEHRQGGRDDGQPDRDPAARAGGAGSAASGASARTSRVVDILELLISKKALNDYFVLDVSNQLITCQA